MTEAEFFRGTMPPNGNPARRERYPVVVSPFPPSGDCGWVAQVTFHPDQAITIPPDLELIVGHEAYYSSLLELTHDLSRLYGFTPSPTLE